MEQYKGSVESYNALPFVFREALRRTYELSDEPLPSKLEELLHRLPDATQHEQSA
jgi:hypothetical protein